MSSLSLLGKTILVTGSSSNIGKSIAIECAELGASVLMVARNKEKLEIVKSSLKGYNHQYYCCDLSLPESIDALIDIIPTVDGIVLSAAQFDTTPIKFIDNKSAKNIFNTNTLSAIILLQRCLKKKKINNGGSIVFISSVASKKPYIGNALYSATKGAINSFSKVLALELGSKGIRVNSVLPGIVKRETGVKESNITAEEQIREMNKFPLGVGYPIDVANAVLFLLSDAARWVTGIELTVDGGQSLI